MNEKTERNFSAASRSVDRKYFRKTAKRNVMNLWTLVLADSTLFMVQT